MLLCMWVCAPWARESGWEVGGGGGWEDMTFSNSLIFIIHEEKTKGITTVEGASKCDLNYHKIW